MPKITEKEQHLLRNFLGGIFNQDFGPRFSSWEEAIEYWAEQLDKKESEELGLAIWKLSESRLGEKALERSMTQDYGVEVWPVDKRGREWLKEIKSILDKKTTKSS